jgi:aryl-alcohol dehydrogenase-like predicted oxidoreductase
MWGFGGDVIGWTGGDAAEQLTALHRAVELGCNFFDTAWIYGRGLSEQYLGDIVRQSSDRKIVCATKIPPKNRQWPSRRGMTLDEVFPPDHIREYTEKSLSNVGVGCVDLMQFHVWEDDWVVDERWQRTISDLKAQGLIAGIGISVNRWEPWNGVRAVRTGLIDVIQVIYNIFDQSPEDELFPLCSEMGVGIIARVPFDEGSLCGTLTLDSKWPEGDWRNTYFGPENLAATVRRIDALQAILPAGMTLPEMALRFILGNSAVSTVIPGMRSVRHVEANMAASDLGELPPDLRTELRKHRWDREPAAWSD